jgi:hypothetical protein
MAGAIVFAVVMVLLVPVAIMFAGAIWSALFGWLASEDADARAASPPEPEPEPADAAH